jgi:hypothetical protein
LQQTAQLPAAGPVKTLFLSHTCCTITWYFELATTPLPIRGINIIFVNEEKKIVKAYWEVNSGALLWNLGKPECQANFTVSVGKEGIEPDPEEGC